MKKLQIVSKAKANSIIVDSLFKTGGTLNTGKYCTGKYKPGSMPVGREFTVSDDVFALWAVNGKDADGPFVRVMCAYK